MVAVQDFMGSGRSVMMIGTESKCYTRTLEDYTRTEAPMGAPATYMVL